MLANYIKGFNKSNWIKATAVGAGVAWLIGMLPSTFGDYVSSIPVWLLIPIGLVLSCLLLISIGAAQYFVLRNYVTNASKWIWINVIACLVGLIVVCGFIFAAPDGFFWTLSFSLIGGFGMAFTMAIITGKYVSQTIKTKIS